MRNFTSELQLILKEIGFKYVEAKMIKRNILFVMSIVLVLSFFVFATIPSVSAGSCVRYFSGTAKGITSDNKEAHHYVDFAVNISSPDQYWKVTKSPLPTSLWPGTYTSSFNKRAGYSWPFSWWDPFSPSQWQICLLSR